MKKLSKQVLCVSLALIFFAFSMVAVSAAEAEGCFNKFSDTVYDFSGFINSSDGTLSEANNGGYLRQHKSNTNSYNTVKQVTEDGMSALELAHGIGGPAAYIQPQTYVDLDNNEANYFTKAHIAFRIKVTGNDTDPFALTFRENGSVEVGIVEFRNGKIKFLGQELCSYRLDTWYDFDLRVDLTQQWGYLKLREKDAEQWTEYERFCENFTSPQNGNVYSCKSSFWIAWQYLGTKATDAKVYLTNLMQNTDEGTSQIALSSNFDTESSDDWYRIWSSAPNHALAGVQVSSNTNLDSRYYWLLQNFGAGGANISNRDVDGDGDLECVITTAPGKSVHNMMIKRPWGGSAGNASGQTHIFKFKMGIGSGESLRYFGIRFSNGTDYNLIRMYNNMVKLATDINEFPSDAVISKTTPGYLYDCAVIYDAAGKCFVVSITDEEGKQFTSQVDLSSVNADVAGPHFAHQSYSDSEEAYEMYIDDVSWEVLPDAAAVESAGISWENPDQASLDESVVIVCSEPLDQEKCVGNAGIAPSVEVTIEADGAPAELPYILSTEDNRLIISLMDLDPGVNYKVTASGITTLRGQELLVPVSASFTTTTDKVTAATPTKSGNTVSATVTAPYANGKEVILIVGVYDGQDKLIDVMNVAGTATRSEPVTLTADVSAYSSSGGQLRAFVWSDYNTMQPYSGIGVFE